MNKDGCVIRLVRYSYCTYLGT